MTYTFEGGKLDGKSWDSKDRFLLAPYVEHTLDYGHPTFYTELYEAYKFEEDQKVLARYVGLRRLGGIKLNFNPKRLTP